MQKDGGVIIHPAIFNLPVRCQSVEYFINLFIITESTKSYWSDQKEYFILLWLNEQALTALWLRVKLLKGTSYKALKYNTNLIRYQMPVWREVPADRYLIL